MKRGYEVVVGNIGTVYSGHYSRAAWDNYHHYVEQSKIPGCKCHNEPVTLFEDGEIRKEYIPKNAQQD